MSGFVLKSFMTLILRKILWLWFCPFYWWGNFKYRHIKFPAKVACLMSCRVILGIPIYLIVWEPLHFSQDSQLSRQPSHSRQLGFYDLQPCNPLWGRCYSHLIWKLLSWDSTSPLQSSFCLSEGFRNSVSGNPTFLQMDFILIEWIWFEQI
jgi:hypothetical protein